MNGFTERGLGVLAAVAAVLAPVPASGQHFPPTEELELMLRYQAEDGAAPGVALGLVEEDGSTSVLTCGHAGPGGESLGPGSVFELGDLTMTFTATLLAVMAERGELSLDDPVSRYLGETVEVPSLAGRPITLRDLALHRSGLPAEPPEPYDRFTIDDLYTFLSDFELDYSPGQKYEFSILGYGLLGHALARAAGEPLPTLLRQRVLEPLGMDRTGYGLEGERKDRMVRGHHDGAVVPYSHPTDALQGATGLRSSATDMVAYLEANTRPPDTALGRAMRVAREVRGSNDPTGEGRGFSWRQYVVADEPLLVSHGGRTPGFTSLITFDAARGIGTVVLANSGDLNPWFSRNLLWLEPWPSGEPSGEDRSVGATAVQRYAGTYSTTVGRYMAAANRGRHFVRLEGDGRLTYQRTGGVRIPLQPRSDSSFYMVGVPFTLTFIDIDGDDMQLIASVDERESLRQQGQRWKAWRMDEETPPIDAMRAGSTIVQPALFALLAAVVVGIVSTFWMKRRRA